MNLYRKLKDRQQERMNAFLNRYAFFAFSKEQYAAGLQKFGLSPDAAEGLISISGGGYLLKDKAAEFYKLLEKTGAERQAALDDPEAGAQFAFDMFRYELANHEYGYTGDAAETLAALGYTPEEVQNSDLLREALTKAEQHCMEREAL